MKKLIALFILSVSSLTAYVNAQVQLCLGQDATVCAGQTVQITNCGGGTTLPNGPIALTNPSSVSLSDDVWSGIINIGFTFSFYGVNYTQCVIGSNGLVSFNTAVANSSCAWSLSGVGTLPNSSFTTPQNTTMICYSDLNPGTAGANGGIFYQTLGTAPNRRFVVLYQNIPTFGSSDCNYMGLVLYEGTNILEHYISLKAAISTWNGGLAIQGSEKAGGTVAHITPGRNNTQWTASQDAKRYTPTSPTNTNAYTITNTTYYPIFNQGVSLQWMNTLGQTFAYNSGVLNVNTVPPGTTGYFLTANASGCSGAIGGISDTTFITRDIVNGTGSSTTDYCAGGVGTATVTPGAGVGPFTFSWAPSGQTSATATNVFTGNNTVTITDALGCTGTVVVNVPNTNASFSGTTTQVSCPGGSDGTATATMTPALGTVSYNWYDAGGQTTQTATGLTAGTYHCEVSSTTGCIDTVEVTVTEIPGMVSQIINQSDVTCNSGNDGVLEVAITDGTAPYTYSWSNSASSTNMATDLVAGNHVLTITDANSCVITVSVTIGEPSPLRITSLTPDLIICPENSTTLAVTGSGGNGPAEYIFTWKEDGTIIGTGTTIVVDPVNSGTQYCVVLTEICGSPSKDSCMNITFPTPIIPDYVADKLYSCSPGAFTFYNNSSNKSEIDHVDVDYGNGFSETVNGPADLVYTYTNPGIYTIDVVTTSIQGCVTTETFPGIANVIPNPVADFNMSSNPTTFFETYITMQDKSSPSVNSWKWYSPGSTPLTSSTESPVFHFPEGVVGTYDITLIVETPEGCIDTITKILTVNSDIIFYAPNSFTPDGDEFNQNWLFYVSGIDEYNFELLIFNRWGEVMWETKDPHASWDGTYQGQIVPNGAYSWIARVKDIYNDSKKTFTGSINVIR